MREICTSGLTSGDWKRGCGPNQEGTGRRRMPPENGFSSRPTATAPVADSTAAAGRQTVHGNRDPEFVGQHLQFPLPQAHAVAIAAAAVGIDQKSPGTGVAGGVRIPLIVNGQTVRS